MSAARPTLITARARVGPIRFEAGCVASRLRAGCDVNRVASPIEPSGISPRPAEEVATRDGDAGESIPSRNGAGDFARTCAGAVAVALAMSQCQIGGRGRSRYS